MQKYKVFKKKWSPYTYSVTEDEENDLADRLKNIASRGFGCTVIQVRNVDYYYSEMMLLKHPWDKFF